MNILDATSWTVRTACNVDSESVALERTREYDNLPRESAWDTKGELPVPWPSKGELMLEGVTARHREDLAPALHSVTMKVEPSQKMGVVGRTGAGKSTLASVLLRVVEVGEGRVLLDGVDTKAVGLQQLRSRVTIVPQDSVIFSGTLRFNLDPWGEKGEQELIATLMKLGERGGADRGRTRIRSRNRRRSRKGEGAREEAR